LVCVWGGLGGGAGGEGGGGGGGGGGVLFGWLVLGVGVWGERRGVVVLLSLMAMGRWGAISHKRGGKQRGECKRTGRNPNQNNALTFSLPNGRLFWKAQRKENETTLIHSQTQEKGTGKMGAGSGVQGNVDIENFGKTGK